MPDAVSNAGVEVIDAAPFDAEGKLVVALVPVCSCRDPFFFSALECRDVPVCNV